jgi:hypothetical protein
MKAEGEARQFWKENRGIVFQKCIEERREIKWDRLVYDLQGLEGWGNGAKERFQCEGRFKLGAFVVASVMQFESQLGQIIERGLVSAVLLDWGEHFHMPC